MKRILKWIVIGLLVLLLLAIVTLWVLAGTEKGFKFSAKQAADQVAGLEVTDVSGNLRTGFRTAVLSYESPVIKLEARGIDTAWRMRCLLQREFCLDHAIVDELNITSLATTTSAESDGGDIVLPSIVLPINVIAKNISIKRLRFQPPGDVPAHIIDNVHLQARSDGSQVTLTDISAEYQNYRVKVSGTTTLEGDYPLNLAVQLNAHNILPEVNGAKSGNGTATDDLSVSIQLGNNLRQLDIDTTFSGALNASLSGQAEPLQKSLPLSLTLSAPAIGWPLDTHAQLSATNLKININGTLADYQLTLFTHISGEQIPASSVSLTGLVNTERLSLPDIGVGTLGGTIDGSVSVSWANGLSWLTELELANIKPQKQYPELAGLLNGHLQANGSIHDGKYTLDINQATVKGILSDYPFLLDAEIHKGLDNIWNIDTLKLNNGNNRLTASGIVSDVYDISATARLPALHALIPGLTGNLNAEVKMSGPLTTPSLNLAANTTALKYNDITIDGLSLKADINDAALSHSTLLLAAGTVELGTQLIQNTRLVFDGKRSEHRISLFSDGPQATAIDLLAKGGIDERLNWHGSLEQVEVDVPAHKIRLREPFALAWDNKLKQFGVDPHCWISEETSICLENKVLAQPTGSATITLDRYLLERMNPFLPADSSLYGALNLETTIHWGSDQPGGFSAKTSTAVKDGGFKVVDENGFTIRFDYNDMTLDATADGKQIDAAATIQSNTMGDASVAVILDPYSDTRTINGTVDLDGFDVAFVKAFLPQFEEISGSLNVSGDLSGSLTDPDFNGLVSLDDPIVRSDTLPLSITGGSIVTHVKGKRAFMEGKLASDDGSINIDGTANWQRDNWRADIDLVGENLNIQQDPLQASIINHNIRIGAQPGSIRIIGDVDIPSADISIRDLPKGAATVSSDVVIIEDIDKQSAEDAIGNANDTELVVAVNVSLGDKVNLQGYGLKSRLTGDMSIAIKSPNPPQLGGEIRVVDGVYKQYGQNLQANGQVLFVGPVDQSRLNIDAIREIEREDRIAGLRITGTVAKPEINLFSEPSDKSEEAILSYIVLGRDIGETTDQEANLLATAALALTVKSGRGLAGSIAETLGVEEFAFETRGNGSDTELVVSGRLNDRLLLRYGRSVFSSLNTLYLRYDISKKLYLEAADGAERAVDLFYTFAF